MTHLQTSEEEDSVSGESTRLASTDIKSRGQSEGEMGEEEMDGVMKSESQDDDAKQNTLR